MTLRQWMKKWKEKKSHVTRFGLLKYFFGLDGVLLMESYVCGMGKLAPLNQWWQNSELIHFWVLHTFGLVPGLTYASKITIMNSISMIVLMRWFWDFWHLFSGHRRPSPQLPFLLRLWTAMKGNGVVSCRLFYGLHSEFDMSVKPWRRQRETTLSIILASFIYYIN